MPRPRRASTKAKAPEDVRGRVLRAAVRLIGEAGLASLSMREVARAAGVSHQAPYHYFDDREAILAALAEEGFTILSTRLERARDPSEPPAARMASLGRAYVQFACDHPSLFRVMFRPDFVDAERFPSLRACGERAFATLPASLKECVAAGLPAEPSFDAHVVLAWSLVHGLACLILDGPLALKLPDAAKARDAMIDDVMADMRLLLEARMPRAGARAR